MINMKKYIIFFWFLLTYAGYGLLENRFNALLEIQEETADSFQNFKIQYKTSENDSYGWNDLKINNTEVSESNRYLATGIDTYTESNSKQVFLRIINTTNLFGSNPIEINISPKRVTFLKLLKSNDTNSTPSLVLKYNNILPYYEIVFPVRRLEKDEYNDIILMSPRSMHSVAPSSLIHFYWQIFNFESSGATVYLIIGKGDDIELEKIDITGLSEYDWNISPTFLYGEYWWQIIVEYGPDRKYGSETRKFYIGDIYDADDDNYNDIEEIVRKSDPNNDKDIPLLITSSPICLTGYVGQQYHLVLDVNDRKRRIYWWPLGELPAGLRLTEQGVLCGIPEKAGDFIFNAEVLNEDNKKDQVRFYLKIDKAVSSEIKVGKGHID